MNLTKQSIGVDARDADPNATNRERTNAETTSTHKIEHPKLFVAELVPSYDGGSLMMDDILFSMRVSNFIPVLIPRTNNKLRVIVPMYQNRGLLDFHSC